MTSGGAALAGGGGARWLGAHVVADAGHDVAEVVQVLVGQGVEQQAGDLDVAGHDPAEHLLTAAPEPCPESASARAMSRP